MAREEADREDLLREAVALVRRIELRVAIGSSATVTVGYRRNGAISLFFDADPVWQFNAAGELRRGYVAGKLLKADRGQLVEMTRVRTAAETQLLARDLTADESETVLTSAGEQLSQLLATLQTGRFEIVGQVPPEADVVAEVIATLEQLPQPPRIAQSPRAGD
ncbi:MAG: hypothetical protein QM775_19040 [Pirellulales bacterium]